MPTRGGKREKKKKLKLEAEKAHRVEEMLEIKAKLAQLDLEAEKAHSVEEMLELAAKVAQLDLEVKKALLKLKAQNAQLELAVKKALREEEENLRPTKARRAEEQKLRGQTARVLIVKNFLEKLKAGQVCHEIIEELVDELAYLNEEVELVAEQAYLKARLRRVEKLRAKQAHRREEQKLPAGEDCREEELEFVRAYLKARLRIIEKLLARKDCLKGEDEHKAELDYLEEEHLKEEDELTAEQAYLNTRLQILETLRAARAYREKEDLDAGLTYLKERLRMIKKLRAGIAHFRGEDELEHVYFRSYLNTRLLVMEKLRDGQACPKEDEEFDVEQTYSTKEAVHRDSLRFSFREKPHSGTTSSKASDKEAQKEHPDIRGYLSHAIARKAYLVEKREVYFEAKQCHLEEVRQVIVRRARNLAKFNELPREPFYPYKGVACTRLYYGCGHSFLADCVNIFPSQNHSSKKPVGSLIPTALHKGLHLETDFAYYSVCDKPIYAECDCGKRGSTYPRDPVNTPFVPEEFMITNYPYRQCPYFYAGAISRHCHHREYGNQSQSTWGRNWKTTPSKYDSTPYGPVDYTFYPYANWRPKFGDLTNGGHYEAEFVYVNLEYNTPCMKTCMDEKKVLDHIKICITCLRGLVCVAVEQDNRWLIMSDSAIQKYRKAQSSSTTPLAVNGDGSNTAPVVAPAEKGAPVDDAKTMAMQKESNEPTADLLPTKRL